MWLFFVLTLHFLGDFVFQTDWMALNKSKRWDALALHCLIYSIAFLMFYGPLFAAITYALHFVTDAVTSRITSRLFFFRPSVHSEVWTYIDQPLWLSSRRHWFFVMIGLDQLLHFGALIWCLQLVGT